MSEGSPRSDADLSIDEQVLVELRRIIRATQLAAKKLASESGLTTSQLVLLELIGRAGEATAGQIAIALNLSQATVTSLLDRLQARDLVVRERGQLDRRVVRVRLSERGQHLLSNAPESLQHRLVAGFAELQNWEKLGILSALQRLSHLMDAANLDAAPILAVGPIAHAADTSEHTEG